MPFEIVPPPLFRRPSRGPRRAETPEASAVTPPAPPVQTAPCRATLLRAAAGRRGVLGSRQRRERAAAAGGGGRRERRGENAVSFSYPLPYNLMQPE